MTAIRDAVLDPVAYVVAKNLERRHLTKAQRAMVAARIAGLEWGQTKAKSRSTATLTTNEAAEQLGVGRRSVDSARRILDTGTEELRAAGLTAPRCTTGRAERVSAVLEHHEQPDC